MSLKQQMALSKFMNINIYKLGIFLYIWIRLWIASSLHPVLLPLPLNQVQESHWQAEVGTIAEIAIRLI